MTACCCCHLARDAGDELPIVDVIEAGGHVGIRIPVIGRLHRKVRKVRDRSPVADRQIDFDWRIGVAELGKINVRRPSLDENSGFVPVIDGGLDRGAVVRLADPAEAVVRGERDVAGEPARGRLVLAVRRSRCGRACKRERPPESQHQNRSLHLSPLSDYAQPRPNMNVHVPQICQRFIGLISCCLCNNLVMLLT